LCILVYYCDLRVVYFKCIVFLEAFVSIDEKKKKRKKSEDNKVNSILAQINITFSLQLFRYYGSRGDTLG
jgi:hypothetical protein